MKKITKASIVGLSMLTVVPNVVCKQPKAMFSAIKSFFWGLCTRRFDKRNREKQDRKRV